MPMQRVWARTIQRSAAIRPWCDYVVETVRNNGDVCVFGPLSFHGVPVTGAKFVDVSPSALFRVTGMSETALTKTAQAALKPPP